MVGGKSIFDYIREQREEPTDSPITDMDPDSLAMSPDHSARFVIDLKKKRRTAMLRQMLAESGNADLAKMISIRESKE